MPDVPAPVDLPVSLPPGRVTPELIRDTERAIRDLIPPGKRGVFVAVADNEAATAVVATRLRKNWVLSAEAIKTWRGATSGRLRIVGSW